MRSTTIRSFVFLVLGGAIAACTATAVDPTIDSDGGMAAAEDSGGQQDDSSMRDMDSTTGMDSNTVDSGRDGAITDTGLRDAPFDGITVVDASFDPPGSACPTNNLIQRDPSCGICGYRDRVCLAVTDGGAKTWQPWGACQAEIAGGCLPGTMDNASCGFCGHVARTCQSDCSWAAGSCTGTGMCSPGDVQFAASVSCDAGLGRTRTCDGVCMWGDYSTSCAPPPPPPTAITISATVGNVASTRFILPTKIAKIATGMCPVTLSTTSMTSYVWIKVKNPTAQIAKVSVWSSLQVGGTGTLTDTIMAAYPGTATAPSTPAQRTACTGRAIDDCDDNTTDSTACTGGGAGLMKDDLTYGDQSVTIPANGFLWVYVASYFSTTGVTDLQISTFTHSLM